MRKFMLGENILTLSDNNWFLKACVCQLPPLYEGQVHRSVISALPATVEGSQSLFHLYEVHTLWSRILKYSIHCKIVKWEFYMSQFYHWINRFLYYNLAFLKPFAQVQSMWMWPSVLQVNYSREKKTNAFLKTCLCNFLCIMENNSISVLLKKLKLSEDGFRVKGNWPSTHQTHCGSNNLEVVINIK